MVLGETFDAARPQRTVPPTGSGARPSTKTPVALRVPAAAAQSRRSGDLAASRRRAGIPGGRLRPDPHEHSGARHDVSARE